MKRPPLSIGLLVGLVLPSLILAPAFFWGQLAQVVDDRGVYLLLVPLSLLIVPGIFAGQLAARYAPDRKAAWRFATGLLVGASLAAASLLFWGTGDVDLLQRLVIAAFGGPILAGFWLWLGAVLGLSFGYGRMERRQEETANP